MRADDFQCSSLGNVFNLQQRVKHNQQQNQCSSLGNVFNLQPYGMPIASVKV